MKSAHALTAQAIRKELKEKYKGVKFSVRSESYAGGDAVTVYFPADQISREEVDGVVRKYQEGDFNAMEDIYEFSNKREDLPQVKYVQVQRAY